MARPLRIVYEGAACHIISRGNRAEYMEAKNKVKAEVEGKIEQ